MNGQREDFVRLLFSFFIMFFILIIAAFWTVPKVSEGACGAAASSCKNCHEVKGEMRVNDKGDYHTQHAFGDFCVFCHSGNTAATTTAAAHEGMVKPLASLEQSCAACHPDDFEEKSKGYGAVIKPKGSSGGSGPAAKGPGNEAVAGKTEVSTETMAAVSVAPAPSVKSYEILPPTPDPATVKPDNLIDYNLYWADKGLSLTLGDWILILLSLIVAMGIPFLYWHYEGDKSGLTRLKEKAKESIPMQKKAMDEGTA
jgi:hypothetical protein